MSGRFTYLIKFAVTFCCGLFIACAYGSQSAYAALEMPRTDIVATVMKDGSLKVEESREFKFDEDVNGVYWVIPQDNIRHYSIDKVGLLSDDRSKLEEFKENPRAQKGDHNVYTAVKDDNLTVKLFKPSRSSDTRIFYLSYTVENAVHRYKDIAELNWKFVGDAWKQSSQKVTLSLNFEETPQPGKFVAGQSVHAFGHGNLAGNIEVREQSVVYHVKKVRPQEFAEAHVLFDTSLVPLAKPDDTVAYDRLLQEERDLAQKTNDMKLENLVAQARFILYEFGLSSVLAVIIFVLWLKWGKDYKPQFKDKYFRDLPLELHPALLAYIWRGKYASQDLSAGILRLVNKGAVRMTRVQKAQKSSSKIEYDYLIEDAACDLDQKPFSFIDKLCHQVLFPQGHAEKSFLLSEYLEVLMARYPETYLACIQNFEDEINYQAKRCGYFERIGRRLRIVAMVLCAFQLMILFSQLANFISYCYLQNSVVSQVDTSSFFLQPEFTRIAFGVIAANLVVIIVSMLLAKYMVRRPQNIEDVKAKMSALRRWFKDFTLLKEAIPGDVVVWKDLLVLAVVMDVAQEVVDQLKIHAPQLFEDLSGDAFGSLLYRDMYYFNLLHQQSHEFAHAQKLEDFQDFASGFGSGGGFSIGGGGGFGGGGGGSF